MAQQTYNDGDQLSVIRSVINNNATDAESRLEDNKIIVKDVTDFGVIDSTKIYYLDGIIDMGTTSIEVPVGGISIHGSTFDVSQLVSTEANYTMFTSPVGGSGNILMHDLSISTSGTNSKVFAVEDATGFNAIEIEAVNFNDCTSLGSLTNYRQGLETGTGRFGGSPELEFIGTWVGGYRVATSIVRSVTIPTALFKAGAGFTSNGRIDLSINADLPATGAFCDFSASNIVHNESLQIEGCRITRNGVIDTSDTTLHPNITEHSERCLWFGNVGIPNTIKYIRSTCTTEVTTPIASGGVSYKLLGTFTVDSESHFDMPTNGEFRLLSGNGTYQIIGDLVLDSGANDVLDIRVTKSSDGGSTWPTLLSHTRRQVNSLVGGRNVGFFPINFISTMVATDRIRIEVANIDDTTDVTMELDSYFIVTAL